MSGNIKVWETEQEYRKAHEKNIKKKLLDEIGSVHFKIDKTDPKKNNFDYGVAMMRQFCLELIEKEMQ